MITNADNNVTAEIVAKELKTLENDYRARKRKLRALLAVLEQENTNKESGDDK